MKRSDRKQANTNQPKCVKVEKKNYVLHIGECYVLLYDVRLIFFPNFIILADVLAQTFINLSHSKMCFVFWPSKSLIVKCIQTNQLCVKDRNAIAAGQNREGGWEIQRTHIRERDREGERERVA